MSTRALDRNGDWTFGAGQSNYLNGLSEIIQNIQTGIKMFLNDCFFATSQGIDWYNLFASKNAVALNLAISAAILNVMGGGVVTAVTELTLNINPSTRAITISYNAKTALGSTGTVSFDVEIT